MPPGMRLQRDAVGARHDVEVQVEHALAAGRLVVLQDRQAVGGEGPS